MGAGPAPPAQQGDPHPAHGRGHRPRDAEKLAWGMATKWAKPAPQRLRQGTRMLQTHRCGGRRRPALRTNPIATCRPPPIRCGLARRVLALTAGPQRVALGLHTSSARPGPCACLPSPLSSHGALGLTLGESEQHKEQERPPSGARRRGREVPGADPSCQSLRPAWSWSSAGPGAIGAQAETPLCVWPADRRG